MWDRIMEAGVGQEGFGNLHEGLLESMQNCTCAGETPQGLGDKSYGEAGN